MIYIVCHNDNLKDILNITLENEKITFLNDKTEIFNILITTNDILILSLDIFDDIHAILDFINALPTTLKVMALRDKTNLAEGTLVIKKGIKSYFQSNLSSDALVQVLQIVKDGNTWVYPSLMSYIIQQMNSVSPSQSIENNILDKLSNKEKEVALLVASGNSNQKIADSLDVALVTVKKHVSKIFEKLDVKDRVSLSILVNS